MSGPWEDYQQAPTPASTQQAAVKETPPWEDFKSASVPPEENQHHWESPFQNINNLSPTKSNVESKSERSSDITKNSSPSKTGVEEFEKQRSINKTLQPNIVQTNVDSLVRLASQIPGFLVKAGGEAYLSARLASDVATARDGKEIQTTLNWANHVMSSPVGKIFSNPIEEIEAKINPDEFNHVQGAADHILSFISQSIDHAIQHAANGNKEQEAELSLLSDNIQAFALPSIIKVGKAAWNFSDRVRLENVKEVIKDAHNTGTSSEQSAEFILDQFVKQGGDPATLSKESAVKAIDEITKHTPMTDLEKDAVLNARKRAMELTSRNASPQEVGRIIKQNPLVGTEIDKIMDERRGIRQGPMASVHQGEVLPSHGEGIIAPQEHRTYEGEVHPLIKQITDASQHLLLTVKEEAEANGEVPWKTEPTHNDAPLGQQHPEQGGYVGFGKGTGEGLNKVPGEHGTDAAEPGGDVHTGGPDAGVRARERMHNADFFRKQMGAADKRLVISTGLVLGGSVLGAYLSPNDHSSGLIAGAAFGLGLATLPKAIHAIGENWKSALKTGATGLGYMAAGTLFDKDNPVEGAIVGSALFGLRFLPKSKIHPEDDLVNAYYGNRLAEDRLSSQITKAMQDIIPDQAKREQLGVLAEDSRFTGRTKEEKLFIASHRKLTDSYAEMSKDVGLKMGFIESYVSHIVEGVGIAPSKVQEIVADLFKGPEIGLGGKARFTKERKFATFAELEKALPPELKVKTKDLAEIDKIYTKAMTRTIERQKLINNLKAATLGDPKGENANLITTEQRPGYVRMGHPQLLPYWVSPDIAPSLKFVFDAKSHGDTVNGLMALNRTTKRLNVVGSFFHAKSLLEAYALAGGNLLTANQAIKSALKQFHDGGLGDEVDKLIRAGMVVKMPEDVAAQALTQVGQLADQYVNKMLGTQTKIGEKALGGLENIQKNTFDKFTWDYLHPGLKISTALRLMEDYKLGKAGKGMSETQYRQGVASHVNKTFGGANWYQLVSESKTKAGRAISMFALNPTARDWLGIVMFAPDWTLSTFRAMADALPGGAKNPMSAKLAQRYALRTAVLYGTTLNLINNILSGHNMWENKDPTRIDNGDGTTSQVVKHSMEFAEWATNPAKTFSNKMGFIPRNIQAWETGKQYVGGPPIEGSKLKYVAEQALPFTAKGFQGDADATEQAGRSLLSMFGVQVMGMTQEQKQQAQEARRQRKEESQ